MKTAMVLITLLLFAIIGLVLFQGITQDETAKLENLPAIDAGMIEELQARAQRIGSYLSWGVIAASFILQMSAWIAANRKFRSIKRLNLDAASKMQLLENIEVYFDLPLYFGLLGTVMSFILITVFPDAGLMFAYVSTGMGIIVSVTLRLVYLTPYRHLLIENTAPSQTIFDIE